MSILIGNKEEMESRYKENCELAKEALTYTTEIITKCKEENKELNNKLNEKPDEFHKIQILQNRYNNYYIIRNLNPVKDELAETQYTGVTPYRLIEEIRTDGRPTPVTEHMVQIASILRKMGYFPDDYFN